MRSHSARLGAIGFSTTTCFPASAARQVASQWTVVGQAQDHEVDLGEIEQGAVIGEVAGDAPLAGEALGTARGGRGHGDDLGTRDTSQRLVVDGRDEPRADQAHADGILHRSARTFQGRRRPAIGRGSRADRRTEDPRDPDVGR